MASPQPTLLQRMGGVSGLVYSSLPTIVFVVVNATLKLNAAVVVSITVAVAIAVLRKVRGESLQPAWSGLFGVVVGALVSYLTGSAKDYFVVGIWVSLVIGLAFGVSVLVRWPLVGVLWNMLNGNDSTWRTDPSSRRAYDFATLLMTLVFLARFIVQQQLYEQDATGWLAFARIAMGYPLTGVALLATVWAVRRSKRSLDQTLGSTSAPMSSSSSSANARSPRKSRSSSS
jgi:hypothetical protein